MKKLSWKSIDRAILNAGTKRRRRKTRWRPGMELLEVRQTPAVFTVNTTLDTIAANLKTGQDSTGHISLRSAIMAANAQPGADTIMLPNGTFRLTIAGKIDDSGVKGDLDVHSDLTIQGRGHTGTIVDGNGLDRVFDIQSGKVSISQLTIQDGSNSQGGGLRNTGGNVTLTSVFVQNNEALGTTGARGADGVPGVSPPTNGQNGGNAAGGGIDNAHGTLSLVNCTVTRKLGPRRQWRRRRHRHELQGRRWLTVDGYRRPERPRRRWCRRGQGG